MGDKIVSAIRADITAIQASIKRFIGLPVNCIFIKMLVIFIILHK
ncbi:hypothetical protein GCM10020008_23990 [Lentilactobacillus kefiri DSM 20587 = JCM 5818]|uniref:Uncharacterized protein n=1 Tax=Lentilactobacillus kefiri TaxID=33962 RepID=A0A511DTX3_LENKE|nr:hypothetical protein LKE01_05030 [Lentilactobacillus kefiri]